MLVDYDGQAITAVEAYELALKGSTTLACTEFGDWMVHVDWTGQRDFPFNVYLWHGDEWSVTNWAPDKREALRRYARTVMLCLFGRSTAAAAAPPQHPIGQQGTASYGYMMGRHGPIREYV